MVKPTSVRNRIRSLREQAGSMTQGDLAEHVGVTRQTINAIEAEKYSPSLEVAFLISRALGVSLDQVFWYEDTPQRRKRDR